MKFTTSFYVFVPVYIKYQTGNDKKGKKEKKGGGGEVDSIRGSKRGCADDDEECNIIL